MVHPDGRVDPLADIEVIEAELLYADLEGAERRLDRVEREARGGAKASIAEEAWLRELVAALGAGRPARTVPVPAAAPDALRMLSPLTAKPVLFVANVEEGEDEVPEAVERPRRLARSRGRGGERPPGGRAGRAGRGRGGDDALELGLSESGLDRVVRGAFELLDLIAFFTAGTGKPAQSRHMRRGLTAWDAAGEVHRDIQAGFVRAEIVGWQELVDAGGYAGARDRGTLRVEGRDYVVADGEVLHVRFTP